jgi:anti-anti-sigma factor
MELGEGSKIGLIVEQEVEGKKTIFSMNGTLDITTTNIVNSHLEEIDEIELLIFDFSKLEFIDSTGIGSILNAIYLSQEKNFKLKLQGINEMTHHVFEMVGIYQIMNAIHGEVI